MANSNPAVEVRSIGPHSAAAAAGKESCFRPPRPRAEHGDLVARGYLGVRDGGPRKAGVRPVVGGHAHVFLRAEASSPGGHRPAKHGGSASPTRVPRNPRADWPARPPRGDSRSRGAGPPTGPPAAGDPLGPRRLSRRGQSIHAAEIVRSAGILGPERRRQIDDRQSQRLQFVEQVGGPHVGTGDTGWRPARRLASRAGRCRRNSCHADAKHGDRRGQKCGNVRGRQPYAAIGQPAAKALC